MENDKRVTQIIAQTQRIPALIQRLISTVEEEEALLDALAAAVAQGEKDAVFHLAVQILALRKSPFSYASTPPLCEA